MDKWTGSERREYCDDLFERDCGDFGGFFTHLEELSTKNAMLSTLLCEYLIDRDLTEYGFFDVQNILPQVGIHVNLVVHFPNGVYDGGVVSAAQQSAYLRVLHS